MFPKIWAICGIPVKRQKRLGPIWIVSVNELHQRADFPLKDAPVKIFQIVPRRLRSEITQKPPDRKSTSS